VSSRLDLAKLQPTPWNRAWVGQAVAWEEGGKHYAGLVAGPGLLTGADDVPTTAIVELHPDYSDRHPEGRRVNLKSEALVAAKALWIERFVPPPAADRLCEAMRRVEAMSNATVEFLKLVAPEQELPDGVAAILTCNTVDSLPDRTGKVYRVDDDRIYTYLSGPFVTILVSRRVYQFVREKATVSGLFYRVATFEALAKEMG
jgi:hypothetical protein